MRPRPARSVTTIYSWARLASIFPDSANFIARVRGLRPLLNRLLQLAPQRRIPRLAQVSFRRWVQKHRAALLAPKPDGTWPSPGNGRTVLLWADTFNNYFRPETMRAALGVLEQAGFEVMILREPLCCGRPLYDFGMLQRAKDYLRRILQVLEPQLDAEAPVIVLEPSCASVFRDELGNLFPNDSRAVRLRKRTFLLAEFLQRVGYQGLQFSGQVLLHGHCHHKALATLNHDQALLEKMGADVKVIDSGCCGMAGAFGFERDKFGLSQAIGERVLLPAVREAGPETWIVSDGFSCREQILQATGREAMHLAQVLQFAIDGQKPAEAWKPSAS